MSHAGTEDKLLPHLFPPRLEGLRVLDIGHGLGQTGLMIRGLGVTRGQPHITGVDIYKPYHYLQKNIGIYNRVLLHDMTEPLPYMDNSFHITIAQQFIEHVPKQTGYRILDELQHVTQSLIIISTPNGYHESGPGTDGNQHSEHLSAWHTRDFQRYGYETRVVTKNVNSRALRAFAHLWFRLRGQVWENEMIVAWRKL